MTKGSPITPTLNLGLPALEDGQLYQLAYVDLCRLSPKSTYQKEVAVFFRIKQAKDGYRLPIGEPVVRWVHLAQARVLVPSSLWTSDGNQNKMVSDGRYYAESSSISNSTLDILPDAREVYLSNSLFPAEQIQDMFPESANLKSSFLRSRANSWVITKQQKDIHYIIPCFELLRAFYYIDTPHLIEYFFSLSPLSTICQVLDEPTNENGQQARLAVVADGFSRHQLCVLAEMCLNPYFLRTVMSAHEQFFPKALRAKAGAPFQVDFEIGREVTVGVTGFEFLYKEQLYFWVCGIRKISPFWSFKQLEYVVGSDHRIGKISSGEEPSISPVTAERATAHLTDSPILDSREKGSSQSQVVAELDLALYTDLPLVDCLPKGEQEQRHPSQRIYFPAMPNYLTTEGGGKDLRKMRLSKVSLKEKLPLPAFFESVVEHLNRLLDFTVTVLQLNNERGRYGDGVSTFPIWHQEKLVQYWLHDTPRLIAIAHIGYKGGNFYFLQMLGGGRAALIYYKSARQIENREFNNLLEYFAKTNFNWRTVSNIYEQEDYFNTDNEAGRSLAAKFRKMMGLGLVISPRNHTTDPDKNPSASILCEKIIRSTFI